MSHLGIGHSWFDTKWWEIYALKGDSIPDTERFETKEDAEKRIKELLD